MNKVADIPLKNRYQKYGKISERKFRTILRYFAHDLTASDTAKLTGVSVRSINTIFLKLRNRIAEKCEEQTPIKRRGELDESYFRLHRVQGKRGRGTGRKTIVFGIFKSNDKVYTEIVPDESKSSLVKVIRGHAATEAVIHTGGLKGYNSPINVISSKHFRVSHDHNEFAAGYRPLNGNEPFWSYAKRRLVKFNGICLKTFYLHLKETEYRYNHRSQNLYKTLLVLLRENPL